MIGRNSKPNQPDPKELKREYTILLAAYEKKGTVEEEFKAKKDLHQFIDQHKKDPFDRIKKLEERFKNLVEAAILICPDKHEEFTESFIRTYVVKKNTDEEYKCFSAESMIAKVIQPLYPFFQEVNSLFAELYSSNPGGLMGSEELAPLLIRILQKIHIKYPNIPSISDDIITIALLIDQSLAFYCTRLISDWNLLISKTRKQNENHSMGTETEKNLVKSDDYLLIEDEAEKNSFDDETENSFVETIETNSYSEHEAKNSFAEPNSRFENETEDNFAQEEETLEESEKEREEIDQLYLQLALSSQQTEAAFEPSELPAINHNLISDIGLIMTDQDNAIRIKPFLLKHYKRIIAAQTIEDTIYRMIALGNLLQTQQHLTVRNNLKEYLNFGFLNLLKPENAAFTQAIKQAINNNKHLTNERFTALKLGFEFFYSSARLDNQFQFQSLSIPTLLSTQAALSDPFSEKKECIEYKKPSVQQTITKKIPCDHLKVQKAEAFIKKDLSYSPLRQRINSWYHRRHPVQKFLICSSLTLLTIGAIVAVAITGVGAPLGAAIAAGAANVALTSFGASAATAAIVGTVTQVAVATASIGIALGSATALGLKLNKALSPVSPGKIVSKTEKVKSNKDNVQKILVNLDEYPDFDLQTNPLENKAHNGQTYDLTNCKDQKPFSTNHPDYYVLPPPDQKKNCSESPDKAGSFLSNNVLFRSGSMPQSDNLLADYPLKPNDADLSSKPSKEESPSEFRAKSTYKRD